MIEEKEKYSLDINDKTRTISKLLEDNSILN
jgi:hypothetical protein